MQKVTKIISGGQTGADRAALDFAIGHAISHGGWCPNGRRAIDGRIPEVYHLEETPSAGYLERNRWNVRDSDGTAIFTLGPLSESSGSRRTAAYAEKLHKPWIHFVPGQSAAELADFISKNNISILNVAGSSSDGSGRIETLVHEVLRSILAG